MQDQGVGEPGEVHDAGHAKEARSVRGNPGALEQRVRERSCRV